MHQVPGRRDGGGESARLSPAEPLTAAQPGLAGARRVMPVVTSVAGG